MSHIVYVVLVNELLIDDPWSIGYNLIYPPMKHNVTDLAEK
jgi:hypothetical protein